jgi:[acyl-carrier-protein] S-malonyltransferase
MTVATGSTAMLFPGQGVSLGGARETVANSCPAQLERCCDLLGDDPFERCGESTRFAQPAIFLASWAGWLTLDGESPAALAGHSLGEVSALAAAETLTFGDALSLVVLRGALMAEAAERHGRGGMLAILKGGPADAADLANVHGVELANDNAPGQTILSGERAALDAALADARARGLRAMRLDVAGAFHSRAMQDAYPPFRRALAGIELAAPRICVYSSTTAAPFSDVREQLAQALVRPVRWRDTMLALHAAGVRRYIDAGPDRVLARLVPRNVKDAEALTAAELDEKEPRGIHA